jgi:hypothetical protein
MFLPYNICKLSVELGRYEEEGLLVGNQKIQLSERITESPQMPY